MSERLTESAFPPWSFPSASSPADGSARAEESGLYGRPHDRRIIRRRAAAPAARPADYYYGLGAELGHSFRSQTPRSHAPVRRTALPGR